MGRAGDEPGSSGSENIEAWSSIDDKRDQALKPCSPIIQFLNMECTMTYNSGALLYN